MCGVTSAGERCVWGPPDVRTLTLWSSAMMSAGRAAIHSAATSTAAWMATAVHAPMATQPRSN